MVRLVAAGTAVLCMLAARLDAGEYQVYAGPMVFGNWQKVGNHIGEATFTVSYQPIGSSVVVGEIRYYDRKTGKQKVESFNGSVTVRTSNSIASIEIRLKGSPSGTSCRVTVRP